MITIYGRGNDAWVSNATLLCEIENEKCVVVDLNSPDHYDMLQKMKDENVQFPAIYFKDHYIGGYQALQQWLVVKKENEIKWNVL